MNIKLEAIVSAVAGASIIGGGTMVLTSHRDNAIQDQKIEVLEEQRRDLSNAVDELNQSVRRLDKNVTILNERLRKE